MKKIINILLIAILSITFIGLALFVINFAKDTFINDNTKADTVSKKPSKDKKEKQSSEPNTEEVQTSQENSSNTTIENSTSEQISNNNNNSEYPSSKQANTENVRTNESGQVIHKTKRYGIDYIDEFSSPAEEREYEDQVMSQSGGGPTEPKDKVDDDGMSQDELDSLSEDEQAGIGYNPNNPRGDVGSPRPIYSDDDTENSSEDE